MAFCCSRRAVAEGCPGTPEVLGNPVQTWVVRGEHGSGPFTASPLPPGPDRATRPSRVSHFEVMGFWALRQAKGADVAGREGAGRAGCPSWLPGSSSPPPRRRPEPEGQGPGLGVREAQFKRHFLTCLTLGKSLDLSEPQLLYLQTGGILAALSKEKIYVK